MSFPLSLRQVNYCITNYAFRKVILATLPLRNYIRLTYDVTVEWNCPEIVHLLFIEFTRSVHKVMLDRFLPPQRYTAKTNTTGEYLGKLIKVVVPRFGVFVHKNKYVSNDRKKIIK